MRELVELIRPRCFVPVHCRTDGVSDPIPPGNWPFDVTALLESMPERIRDLMPILPFAAWKTYEIELLAQKVIWKSQWRNSWTEPTRL